jgi:hypothetical protein
MDRSGNTWCEDSSKHNGGRLMYLLLDKHKSSENLNNSQTTNKISIQTPNATGNLDSVIRGKSYASSHNVNNLLEIKMLETPSESAGDFVWSSSDRFRENQSKDSGNLTEFRLRESAHASMGCEWEYVDENRTMGLRQLFRNQRVASIIPVGVRPSNEDVYNFSRITTNNVAMQELSTDNETQCGENLFTLLNLLKNKYSFRNETNKNILYDYEIHRFAEFYNITDFCLVLAYYDLIFWLKDLNGVIYMWSRTDGSMIRGGCNMKEALVNVLFHQENLYYIEEYTHELISVKEVKDEVAKCYEEGKKTAIVVTDELLKPLKEGKKGPKKQKKKNKKKH